MAKTKKSNAKKRILGLLALALIVVIGVGSGLAYLSDYDAATNKFTLGDTDVEIEEPNWKNPVKAVTEINGVTNSKKDRNGDDVLVGDLLTYSVTATNGDIEPHNIIITDTLEIGLTVDVASISHGGTYDAATRTITWNIPEVGKLSDFTVTFKATVNEQAAGKVVNDAWAKVGDEDARQTNEVENPLTEDPQNPVKSVDENSESGKGGSTVTVGDLITYKIIAYNNTGSAGNVTVVDTLDSQVSFVSAEDGGTFAAGAVRWTFNAVPAHSSITTYLTVKVESVTVSDVLDPITNKVTSVDPGNSYDSNVVTNPVLPPDKPQEPEKGYSEDTVSGAKGAKVNVGDTITYKIAYYNHEADAVDVIITDVIGNGLTVITSSISDGGTYDAATRTITWNITGAAANSNGFVTFEATVNDDALVRVDNEATVKIGDNPEVKTNKVTNPIEETTKPGKTEIKDPTAVSLADDSYLRYKVEFLDADGNHLTDVAQINKIIDTMYYDTSYVYQGTVQDPSILTANIVAGTAYTTDELAALVASGVVYKEFNQILFEYDTTRTSNAAVRYYNYVANNGNFAAGTVATLFTNVVMPSDWDREDFAVIGSGYLIKITAQVCQIDGLSQEESYAELDKHAP